MCDLIEYITKALVDNPDAVNVAQQERGDTVIIELRVAPDDMGRIIGRQGRIARAIRAVLKAATYKERKKFMLEII